VTAQVALSLALLVTAVMFVKTMANLRAVDVGFGNRNVLPCRSTRSSRAPSGAQDRLGGGGGFDRRVAGV
jgi:hypothetical protein